VRVEDERSGMRTT